MTSPKLASDLSPRAPDHPIDEMFLNRWSPRAFDGSSVPDADLQTILEAARWAPSAFNLQPWRFLYAHRGDAHWAAFVDGLTPFNADWAQHAGALVAVVSETVIPGTDGREDRQVRSHTFDAGAAWAQMALQATLLGYHAHAMAGLEFDKVRDLLHVPERFDIHIIVAIGHRADASILPEGLQAREVPSPRRPLSETAFAGPFPS